MMSSLKNHILISMPHMQDPYFGKTVILICEHTKDGAMGLIINRPFQEPDMKDLFSEIYQETENIFKVVPTIYFGGPVMIERGIVLHSSEYKRKGTVAVSENFALTSHKFILQDIRSGEAPESYKLVLGHAGWTRGQLEKEIEHSDWLLQQTSKDFVFNTPDDIMWNQAAKTLGIQTTQITGVGGVA